MEVQSSVQKTLNQILEELNLNQVPQDLSGFFFKLMEQVTSDWGGTGVLTKITNYPHLYRWDGTSGGYKFVFAVDFPKQQIIGQLEPIQIRS